MHVTNDYYNTPLIKSGDRGNMRHVRDQSTWATEEYPDVHPAFGNKIPYEYSKA